MDVKVDVHKWYPCIDILRTRPHLGPGNTMRISYGGSDAYDVGRSSSLIRVNRRLYISSPALLRKFVTLSSTCAM
jgi:hypothetical protein